jgi:arginase
MDIALIVVPYDSGQRGQRMGRGPLHLLEHGAITALEAHGHRVAQEMVETPPRFWPEPNAAFLLQREVATRVAAARTRGAFPIVLSGNCNTAVGTVSGIGPSSTAIVWLDAHGDLNTPESTPSGYIDGMSLSMVTGTCWRRMTASVPGFAPIPEERVILVGARDLDDGERAVIESSPITHVQASAVRTDGVERALGPAVDARRGRAEQVYLHLDLDVHDPDDAQANGYPAPEGLTRAHVRDVVNVVADRIPIAAAAITAFDPDYDASGRMLVGAMELLITVAGRGTTR